ncbi:MAG TPA: Ig-like domain-containing protein [Kofleriaceae bacterium]|nr:Ig-like domain-containing protein [Kofleriaceae bacterium]
MDDAQQFDAQVVDTTPPDTTITKSPAALVNTATAHFEFESSEADSTFMCAIDGAAAVACTSPFEQNVADGQHTFSVAATDKAGNADATPATATWTVDTQAPETQITTKPPALDNSVNVTFEFGANETPVTFECAIDGGAFASCDTPDLINGLADGSHTFAVRATDAAGNVDQSPDSWTWTIDSTTPDTQIDTGPTGSVQATTATFTFSSPNAGPGATFKCGLDGAALTTCASPKSYASLTEADHTFAVQVTNQAGTPDPTPAQRTWTVDHTAPTVTITGGPTGPTNDNTPSFPFTTAGSPTTIECKVDAGAYAACTSPFTTATLPDGAHSVTVRVTDAAGNQGTDSQAFTVDTMGPTTTINSGPGNLTDQTTATFTFSANESPVTFQCAIDGGAFAACTSGKSYGGLGDGMHTLLVRATDQAGNTGANAMYVWNVDTSAATVVIDPPTPTDPTNATGATFMFHSPTDANATYECQIDGGGFATCTSGKAYAGLTGGAGTSHTFQVRATDSAGNTGSPASFTWVIDTQAPTVTIDPPTPSNPTNSTTATFTFHSPSDANATYECHVDTNSYTACVPGKTYTGLTGGVGTAHSFHVRAIDAAGNVGAGTTFNWTIDTDPPTATFTGGPIDPTPTNDATPQFTFTTSGSPTKIECQVDGGAFGACTSPFTTGSLLDGAHTVAVRVTDAATNSTTTPVRNFTVDTVGPTATITGGPIDPTPTNVSAPQFTFTTGGGPTKIECGIDGAFVACTSPYTSSFLADGGHTFAVRVTDAANNSFTTPVRNFTVDTTAPTATITGGPIDPTPTNDATPQFTFTTGGSPTKIECAVDGAFATCTSPYTTSTLVDGGHTFAVRVTDAANNSFTTPVRNFTVDTSGPTATITGGPIDPTPTNDATPQFTFTTAGSPTKIECGVDGSFATCTSPYTSSSLLDGGHTFAVRVTDAANNVFTTPVRNFTIDTAAPTATITSGPIDPTPTNDSTPQFGFTTGGSPTKIECGVDGSFTTCTSPYTTGSLLDGGHTFAVRVTDAATNTFTTPVRNFTVDTSGPTATITGGPVDPTPTNTATPQFTFTTAGSPTKIECGVDGTFVANCTSAYTTSTLAEGGHTFAVRVTDAATNTFTTPVRNFTVDTVAPTASITGGPIDPTPTNTATPQFTFTTGGSPTKIECGVDGTFVANCTSPYTTPTLSDGPHTFAVRVTDAATNKFTTPVRNFTTDTVGPTIAINSKPPAYTPLASTSVTFSTTDGTATLQCSATGGANTFSTCTSPQTYSTGANTLASYSLYVRAKDPAGNFSSIASWSWTVDTRPPTITQAPPSGWTVNYFPFAFTGPSGMSLECSTNGGSTWTACSSPFTATNATYGSANPFAVRWLDSAGNHSVSATASWTPNEGLILYYPLDSDAANYSILEYPTAYYNHDGNVAPSAVQGGFAGGASFFSSGTTYQKTVTPLQSGVGYTVSMWVLTSGQDEAKPVWSNRTTAAGCDLTMSFSKIVLNCYDSTGAFVGSVSPGLPVTNKWMSVVMRFNGTGHGDGFGGDVDLFLNGNLSATLKNSAAKDLFSSKQANMYAGKFTAPTFLLDELRVYNIAYDNKTMCEAVLFGTYTANGCQMEYLGDDYAYEETGSTITNRGYWSLGTVDIPGQTRPAGIHGTSYYYNGFATNLGSFNKDPQGVIGHTLTIWFYDKDTFSGGQLFDFHCPADANRGCIAGVRGGMHVTLNDGKMDVCVDTTNTGELCKTVTYTPNSWTQLMIASDENFDLSGLLVTNNVDIYINGKQVSQIGIGGKGNVWQNIPPNIYLAQGYDIVSKGYKLANAYIDEFKVWPGELTTLGAEATCALGNGGIYDQAGGKCTLPKAPF